MITPQIPSKNAAANRDPQTYAVIGAALSVHQELGSGFLELVYQEALGLEFAARGIPFVREHAVQILYRDQPLKTSYRCDFCCYGELLVELKAIKQLTEVDEAQVIHYLKATRLNKALLINFGSPSLEYKRLISGPAELFSPVQRKSA